MKEKMMIVNKGIIKKMESFLLIESWFNWSITLS
jgi:hypothetical protein